jgi:hypothetical protein
MSDTLVAYEASVNRLNAMAGQGRLTSVGIAPAYRRELKTTMRLLRQLIAEETDTARRGLRAKELRCLKRIHWNMIQLEAIAIIRATQEN